MFLVKLPFEIYFASNRVNTELRNILNVGNVTLRLLTCKDLNRTLNLGKPNIEAHCD
jgi:hypothetical protein